MEFDYKTIPNKPGTVFVRKKHSKELKLYDTDNVRQFIGDAIGWHNEFGWLSWYDLGGYTLKSDS